MKYRALILLILLLLASLAFSPLSQDIPPRPTIQLDGNNGQIVDGVLAAYCWPEAQDNNRCDFVIDATGNPPLEIDLGQQLTIIIQGNALIPTALTVDYIPEVGSFGSSQLPPANNAVFDEPLPTGSNEVQVIAEYADVSGVDAYVIFAFTVNVRESDAAAAPPDAGAGGAIAPDTTEEAPIAEETEIVAEETEVAMVADPTEEAPPMATEEMMMETEEAAPDATEAVPLGDATDAAPMSTEEMIMETEEAIEPVAEETQDMMGNDATQEAMPPVPTQEVLEESTPEMTEAAPMETAEATTEATEIATDAVPDTTEEPVVEETEVAQATEATEEPTPEVTPEVAETTPEPTEEATEVATEVTPEATEEPVAEEPEATEETTPEPTEEATQPQTGAAPTATTVPLVVGGNTDTDNESAADARPTSTTVPLVAQGQVDNAGNNATPPPANIPQPAEAPDAILIASARSFVPAGGNFCQIDDSGAETCTEIVIAEAPRPLSVISGSAVQFRVSDTVRPATVTFVLRNANTLEEIGTDTRQGNALILFNVIAPDGTYILEVTTDWGRTTATYFFRIQVNQ